MKRLALAILAVVLLAAPAFSQSNPFVSPRTVGTSATAALPANPQRKRGLLCNPNITAKIAVCPAISRLAPNPAITCTIGGAGSVLLLPGACLMINGAGSSSGTIPSAWNAVSDTASSSLTAFEWE